MLKIRAATRSTWEEASVWNKTGNRSGHPRLRAPSSVQDAHSTAWLLHTDVLPVSAEVAAAMGHIELLDSRNPEPQSL